MSEFILKIEHLLADVAEKYTPDGSQSKAVVHQWIHAIANNTPLFGIKKITETDRILAVLKSENIYKDTQSFKKKISKDFPILGAKEKKFTFIDLFAGVGGMRIGFQRAGGTCVFSSEFEKNAQATYFQNHGEFPFGDITKVPVKDIPEHDVLVAGFPCQPFSHAGLKLGIDDTRGTLFHNIAEILKAKKPKFALLENVKGLISHDKGYTLQVILRTLTAIGYSCNISKDVIKKGTPKEIQAEAKKMVLKSIDFGVPQNRQRIYIVLWRDGSLDNFEYPKPSGKLTRVGDVLEANPDPKYTISDRLWNGHKRRKIDNKINGKGFGFGLVNSDSPYTNTISARYYKDGSEILIEQDGLNPRKLTPREAARIQGFPEEFIPSQSNVNAYKQLGNSVSVPVIESIAKKINSVMVE
ncbi:DNA cytosine methyltransferase [Cellvibrio sp. UBA7661]|uniref:DNA cytosine methyltransferase n=1 Tax=Cellvibrio sp. UBA7661 TaxID=1946311 RepID=UPI002F35077E